METAHYVFMDKPYPASIIVACLGIIIGIINMPAVHQHWQHRNLPMTAMTAATVYANFYLALNAIIWSHDNFDHWYNGMGFCDVGVKLDLMLNVLFPAAMSCVLRHLANVMDTSRAAVMQTTAQKRRGYVIDSICCFAIPALQIPIHYVVQDRRITIVSTGGCVPTSDASWVSFVFIFLPPLLWIALAACYSILIAVRLVRYRRSFNAILANSRTTKSRFLRLYLLCAIVIAGLLPMWTFFVIKNSLPRITAYSWNETHHPTEYRWNSASFESGGGIVPAEKIVWLVGGFLMFCFFSFGKDAVRSYRTALLAMGFGRCFPALDPANTRKSSISAAISSIGSKAKMMMARKESDMSSITNTVSTTGTTTYDDSPKKMSFLESIKEERRETRRLRDMAPPMKKKKDGSRSFTQIFGRGKPSSSYSDDPFMLSNMNNHIQSSISAEPMSPTATKHFRSMSMGGQDVLVQKEFRQASETAETLPPKAYEGV